MWNAAVKLSTNNRFHCDQQVFSSEKNLGFLDNTVGLLRLVLYSAAILEVSGLNASEKNKYV